MELLPGTGLRLRDVDHVEDLGTAEADDLHGTQEVRLGRCRRASSGTFGPTLGAYEHMEEELAPGSRPLKTDVPDLSSKKSGRGVGKGSASS